MRKPIPPVDGVCEICGKQFEAKEVVLGNYEFSKDKRGKNIFFHTECYEKELKKE